MENTTRPDATPQAMSGEAGESLTMPVVSVIIPTWNAEAFMEGTLRSAVEQTFKDMEIIAMDDCSTDRTAEIAERMVATDPRIRSFRNLQNSGVSKTRNFAMSRRDGHILRCSTALIERDVLLQFPFGSDKGHEDYILRYAVAGLKKYR